MIKFKKKKPVILITGGCGFIGTNLINFLINKKFKIINLDKVSSQSNRKYIKNSKYYSLVKINIAISSYKKILNLLLKFKPDYLINLASETHVDRSIDDPEGIVQENFMIVLKLLEALKGYKKIGKKVRFLHIGTDEVYGDMNIKSKKLFNENSNFSPNNPYSASKASQIFLIKSYSRTFDLDYIICNPSNNFGEFQYPEKLIPRSLYLIQNNLPVELYGSGSNIRNWIYVSDTVRAIYKILMSGRINETYIISSSTEISNKSLVLKLFKILKKKPNIKYISDRPGHDQKYYSNNLKLKKLGWKEKYTFDQSLLKTIEWYKDNKNLPFFKNLKKNIKRLGLK